MIIQTAPPGTPPLAVMMHEHTALCAQFARGFGNDRFESLSPLDLMIYVIGHHDAGWTEFDRDPVTDEKTGLPYNLVETPAEHITVTSRLSPDFPKKCGQAMKTSGTQKFLVDEILRFAFLYMMGRYSQQE